MTVYDGVTINGLHTYRDFELYKVGEFDWGSPEPKRELVEIPGRDGDLDFSTAATGEIKYSNRQCVLNFKARVNSDRQPEFMARISNAFHGAYVEAIDDAESDWYYRGFATVTFPQKNNWQIYVTIAIDAEPYKLACDMSIFTVSPTAFAAETIFLGKGTEAQHINSIFTFGTAAAPQLDLTQFTKLTFRWQDYIAWGTPSLQIVDSNGDTYDAPLTATIIGTGYYAMELNTSAITGIEKSRVYRILCQGRSLVELYGTTQASASIMIPVERMTVVPVWSASEAVTAFINGRKFEIPQGASQNFNARLTAGENQVSFIADSENANIEIQFRNGRL